jgi:hypothetical protein
LNQYAQPPMTPSGTGDSKKMSFLQKPFPPLAFGGKVRELRDQN